MWKALLFIALLTAWAAVGCQAFGTPAPPPTPAVVLLASTPRLVPTRILAPEPAAAVATRSAPPTPTPAPIISLTAAAATSGQSVMGVGSRPALILRSQPQANAPVVATFPGSQVVWAEARTADGRWLRVVVGDAGVRGWAASGDVKLFGEAGDLPELAPAAAAATTPPAVPPLARSVESRGSVTQTAGVLAQPAPAGQATAGGKIVFQLATGGDIYLVNADGSGLRRLTDGMDPALSPDGTRMAFARWGSPHGIFILDLRTGQEQRIASANQPRGPTWRGDGSRVAFTHVTRTRTCVDLGFICPSVEEARRMLGDISRFPLVKVDDNGLAVFALGAVAPDNLISEGTIQALQWRPREDQFVFRGRGGLQTIRPGERPAPLGNDPNIGSPAWSPDGQRLVAQMRIHDRTEIVLLDAGGAVAAYLTQPPPTYERPGKPAPNNVAPAWSPDGQSLLFLSDRDGAWRLYIMQADGANQRPFLPDAVGQLQWRYDFAAERVVNWGK